VGIGRSYSGDYQAASTNFVTTCHPDAPNMIDLSVRCALNFEEGWQIPLVVRFDDAARSVENIFGYVQLMGNDKGDLQQQLVINLTLTIGIISISIKFSARVDARDGERFVGINSADLPLVSRRAGGLRGDQGRR